MSAPGHSSFAEVSRLPDADVRRLLHTGDAQERVWAAWTLGLRLGSDVGPVVSQSVAQEPSAGVRRHLIVILAGAGDREAVQALAVSDPDEEVRATGLQYLARLTGPADPALQVVLADCLRNEPCEDARVVLLENLRPDADERVRSAVEALIVEDQLPVRAAAAERLLEWRTPDAPFPIVLAARVPREPDVPFRRRLLDAWWEAAGGASVVLAVHGFPVEPALAALDLAVERAAKFAWRLLAPIAGRADRRLDQRLVALLDAKLSPDAREWLLALKVESFTREGDWDQQREALATAADAAMPLLEAAYAGPDREPPTTREHALAAELRRQAERRLREAREDPFLKEEEGFSDDDIERACWRERALADLVERGGGG